MLTSMDMYWLTRLDSLNTWLGTVVVMAGLQLFVKYLTIVARLYTL